VSRPRSALLWRSGILSLLVAGGVGAGFAVHGGAAGTPPSAAAGSAKPRPVVCGRRATDRPLPAAFPKTLPLPAGTAITKVALLRRKGFPPVVTIQAFAPMSLNDAALFFLRKLPARGFQILRSEAESGQEAEGRFLGNGTSGAWRVRAGRCSDGVAVLLGVVLPEPAA
jgi:hypothetical protein